MFIDIDLIYILCLFIMCERWGWVGFKWEREGEIVRNLLGFFMMFVEIDNVKV